MLGFIYYTGKYTTQNILKGVDYLIQSSKNNNYDAYFSVAFFYHEGKFVQRDIIKAIHFYKEASSFNSSKAKNNLGVIYKNGFENEITPNIGLAIEYFNEAIKRFNDVLSMYNLSHIYIYNYGSKKIFDKSIELLIRSLKKSFLPSVKLLSIALILKHNFNINSIKQDLISRKDELTNLPSDFYDHINYQTQNKDIF